MPSFRFWVTVPTLLVAAAALSACGGGGGGASSAIPASANGGSQSANATLSIGIQSTGTAGATRSTQSLPTNSSAIAIYTYLANGNPPSTPTLVASLVSAPPCTAASGPRTCSITFSAPVSTSANPTVVAVQIYDTGPINCTNGTNCTLNGGNVIAGGIASQAINVNGANSVNVTLSSVSQQVSISGSSPVALPTLAPIIGGGSGIVGGSLNITVPGNSGLSNGTVLTVGGVAPTQLTVQISSIRRRQQFVAGTGNTYVYAINFGLNPSQTLSVPLQVGASFQVNATLGAKLSARGTLNVAQFNGTTYIDVGTVGYSYAAPTLTITDTGTSGITSGTTSGVVYVIYLPSSGTTTLSPLQGVLNVYALPINGSTDPTPATANDPAAFNSSSMAYGQPSPPVSNLLGTQTAFNGAFSPSTFSSSGFDFTLPGQQPIGVTATCGGGFTFGNTTCAADGTGTKEWIAVQTWPFYVGASGSSNLVPGSYSFEGAADDDVWLVLAPAAFTYAQPGPSFAGVTGLTARTAVVNRHGVNSYGATPASTVSIAAGAGAANLYWITMQYVELVGGGASLSYGWRPSGTEVFGGVTQAVVYGQVTVGGSPASGVLITVTDPDNGTHTLATDANGYYGYNFSQFGSVTVRATSGTSQQTTLLVTPGQAALRSFAF
jgi:hypothetical protein